MRIYYKVIFKANGCDITRRFAAKDFDRAVAFMNRTNGTLCSCKEKITWR